MKFAQDDFAGITLGKITKQKKKLKIIFLFLAECSAGGWGRTQQPTANSQLGSSGQQ